MSSTSPLLPDNLQTGCAVLVVLRVGLQVVDVDVWQAREEQLQLLLIEDGDQPKQEKDDAMLEYEDTIVVGLHTSWGLCRRIPPRKHRVVS